MVSLDVIGQFLATRGAARGWDAVMNQAAAGTDEWVVKLYDRSSYQEAGFTFSDSVRAESPATCMRVLDMLLDRAIRKAEAENTYSREYVGTMAYDETRYAINPEPRYIPKEKLAQRIAAQTDRRLVDAGERFMSKALNPTQLSGVRVPPKPEPPPGPNPADLTFEGYVALLHDQMKANGIWLES